jgi:hypothetical protein
MYFPEANVLVPATTDPDSKTPAFKAVLITLKAENPAGQRYGVQTPRSEYAETRVSLSLVSD